MQLLVACFCGPAASSGAREGIPREFLGSGLDKLGRMCMITLRCWRGQPAVPVRLERQTDVNRGAPSAPRGGHLAGVILAVLVAVPLAGDPVVIAADAANAPAPSSTDQPPVAQPKGPALAAATPQEGRPVKQIAIDGTHLVSEESVRALLRTKVGEPYSSSIAQEDVRALKETRKFVDVYATPRLEGDGVVVTFYVSEKPEVESVEFLGAQKFKPGDLHEDVELGPGSPLDRFAVNRGRDNIERRYKEAGYYYATVSVDEEALKNERRVVYEIVEGPRVRVRKILFEGGQSYSARELKKQIKTKTYIWIFRTGEFDEERAERDAADLLERAVSSVVAAGKDVTYDMKPDRDDPSAVGTSEMADAIIAAM